AHASRPCRSNRRHPWRRCQQRHHRRSGPVGLNMITRKHVRVAILIAAALSASSCGVFKKGKSAKTPVLGERIAVLTSEGDVEVDPATAALPMTLPAPVANPNWTQPGGSASKSV